jgi:uncharacterized protein (DUF1697 family)
MLVFCDAINVAGHATVRKNALKQAFVAAGCKDVRTLIQSGNVLFTCPRDSAAVFRMIQANLRELIGHEVTVVYRTLDELDALVGLNPFKKMMRTKNKKLYVTFLSCKPGKTARFPIESAKEALQAIGMESLDVFTVLFVDAVTFRISGSRWRLDSSTLHW